MSQKQATIEQLFRSHYARMSRLAVSLLHDEEEGKDAVSDVFARLMQARKWPDAGNIEHYLLTAVRNRCLDIIAHKQLHERVKQLIPTDRIVWLSEVSEEQRYAELRAFIDTQLAEQTRQVFRLRFDEHLTYQEIAVRLDISEKTVYKHLHKAVTQMHEHFNTQAQ